MYSYKDNTQPIFGTTQQKASIFLRIIAEHIVDTSRPGTPKERGNLRQDVLKTVNGLKGKIEWRKVYAEYQERGARKDGSHRVKNYSTPGTGPHFAENAVKQGAGSAVNFMKQANLI